MQWHQRPTATLLDLFGNLCVMVRKPPLPLQRRGRGGFPILSTLKLVNKSIKLNSAPPEMGVFIVHGFSQIFLIVFQKICTDRRIKSSLPKDDRFMTGYCILYPALRRPSTIISSRIAKFNFGRRFDPLVNFELVWKPEAQQHEDGCTASADCLWVDPVTSLRYVPGFHVIWTWYNQAPGCTRL